MTIRVYSRAGTGRMRMVAGLDSDLFAGVQPRYGRAEFGPTEARRLVLALRGAGFVAVGKVRTNLGRGRLP